MTSLDEIANIAHVVTESMPLSAAFESIDEVYTITSLGGFEALIHGKHVVCWGSPFYAGWGITTDLNPTSRRTRKLSLEELFAAAYLLYPHYRNPFSAEPIELEDALDLIELGMALRKERRAAEALISTTAEVAAAVPGRPPPIPVAVRR